MPKKTIATYAIQKDYSKHNYKLGEEEQKDIILSYMFKKPIDETLKKYNISERTYYDVVNKHKKNDFLIVDKDIAELRKNFSKKTSILIDKLLSRIEEEIDNKEKDINISQLSTSLGILKDKQSIELGQATSNQAININISVDN